MWFGTEWNGAKVSFPSELVEDELLSQLYPAPSPPLRYGSE